MKHMKQRHWRAVLNIVLAIVFVSLAACGGEVELDAARGYNPTPTPSPGP